MGLKFEFEKDMQDKLKKSQPKAIDAVLYAVGIEWLKNCTKIVTNKWTNRTGDPGIVDTGRLRASLSFITRTKKGNNPKVSDSEAKDQLSGNAGDKELIFGSNVEYAGYINNGTSKMSARPFMQDSINEHKQDYERVAKKILEHIDI